MGMIIRTAFNNQEWSGQCHNADRDRRLFQCKDEVVNTGYKINKDGICQSNCWESKLCNDYKWFCATGNFGEKAQGPVYFIYRDIDGTLVLWGRSSVKKVEDEVIYFKKLKAFPESKRISKLTYEYLESIGVSGWKSGTFRYITDETAEALDQKIEGDNDYFDDPIEPFSDIEGKKILRSHLASERSSKLVKKFKASLSSYNCSVCDFNFKQNYGELGEGFIEAHHTVPLSSLKKVQNISINDLAAVCSNCHRMLHKSNPVTTIAKLKKLLVK
jgi:hypothetical protein